MMRAAHSIKGAARIVGIDAAVRVAHVMEDCFTAAKSNRNVLSSDTVDILLEGLDSLQRICALQPDAEMTSAWLESIIEQLTLVKEGRTAAKTAAPSPADTKDVSLAVQEKPDDPEFLLPEEFNDSAAEEWRERFQESIDRGVARLRIDFEQV